MLRGFFVVLLILALVTSSIGCASTNPDGTPNTAASTAGGAVGGAIIGAGLGALLGLATGDVASGAIYGAIAGAAAGAVAGFVYAKHQEKVLRDRQTAEAMYGYQPSQGETVVIEGSEVAPNTVTNGDQIALNTNYTILTGNDQPVDTVITETITSQGKPVDKPFVDKGSHKSGTYGVSYSSKIPTNVPPGQYTLVTKVQTPNAQDEKTTEFIVAKKAASNQSEMHLASINGIQVHD
jgi:gas vesicle protein